MSAKSKKIELSEEFMAMWREEHILLDIFKTDIFEKSFVSNVKSFSAYPGYS